MSCADVGEEINKLNRTSPFTEDVHKTIPDCDIYVCGFY